MGGFASTFACVADLSSNEALALCFVEFSTSAPTEILDESPPSRTGLTFELRRAERED